jgi:hypothetical protein
MSETWVDTPRVEMVPPNLWHTLTMTGLLEVKNQLMDKIYIARGKPLYLKPLNDALARLELLISVKLNDPSGGS